MSRNFLRVIAPGFLTTVQDLGRFGYAHLGVSASGAADAFSLRTGNLLAGNRENTPALEMTLVGGEFAFDCRCTVVLAGSDFDGNIPLWTPVELKPGESVRCGATRSGSRCYLCVRGGIEVPEVLGSASTHLLTQLGGLEGRALRKHDQLPVGNGVVSPPRCLSRPPAPFSGILRVTTGLQGDWFPSSEFYRAAFQVTEESDRMGLRLRGPVLEKHAGHMLTEGVPLGAVQVPPNGQPIILWVEHQTTGGYPKIANVIAADWRHAGQLRPRAEVRFEAVRLEQALALFREQEEWLHALV